MTIATTEPSSLTAGDTATWLKSLPDYPATDGWALAYTLLNAAGKISIASTPQGADHLVAASATASAAWAAGDYEWVARVSRTVAMVLEAHTVGRGRITVAPAFDAAQRLDTRSQARQALEAVTAYLSNPANLGAASYSIAGRTLARHTIPDLIALKSHLQGEVAREDAAAAVAHGLPDRRRVFVRFGA